MTKEQLLNFYRAELEAQSVSHISIDTDTICFTNDTFKFVLNRYANKFSSFSKGQIKIVDNEVEFIVHMHASMTRLFITAGLIAIAAILFFLFHSGFDTFTLFVGLTIFVLLSIIGYISTSISFPVYFTSVRNKIERQLHTPQ
ncbi:MAG: hypothetical protein ACM3H8_08735 [Sphingobacteriales bacterium]